MLVDPAALVKIRPYEVCTEYEASITSYSLLKKVERQAGWHWTDTSKVNLIIFVLYGVIFDPIDKTSLKD